MPKNEPELQSEFGGDVGSKKAYTVTSPQDDYPRIISQVGREPAVEKTIAPVSQGTRNDEDYDTKGDLETNLHNQFVDVNAIETSPRSYKE